MILIGAKAILISIFIFSPNFNHISESGIWIFKVVSITLFLPLLLLPGRKGYYITVLKLMKSKYWIVRWEALHQISSLDLRGEEIRLAVRDALDDESGVVRKVAGFVLNRIEKMDKRASKLIEALDDVNPVKRATACMKLAEIGFDAAPALPKLKELAQADPDLTVRNHANRAIAKIEPLPYERLVELLDDHNWLERKYAAEALGYIGPEAKRMLPKLKEMVELDDTRQVRDAAKITIIRLGGPAEP